MNTANKNGILFGLLCPGMLRTKTNLPVGPDVPEHEHRYASIVTDPTCTEGGYTTYICSCGDSYIDNRTPAKGHSSDGIVWRENEVKPSCETAGRYDKVTYCPVCDEELSRETVIVPATGHVDTNGDYVCDNCGAELPKPLPEKVLVSADGYILLDANGVYLIPKEDE